MIKTEQDSGTLIALAALGLLAWSLSRKEHVLSTPIEQPIPVGPKSTTVTGGITLVGASSSMASHMVEKSYGSTTNVNINYNFMLKQAGVALFRAWPLRFTVRLGHSVFGGWKTAGELSFFDSGIRVKEGSFTPGTGLQTFAFTTPKDQNQLWDVHAVMEAAESDQNGEPIVGKWQQVGAEAKHDAAVRSVPGTTEPGGSIGPIDVFQRLGSGAGMHMQQHDQEAVLRYQIASVPRGSNVRGSYPASHWTGGGPALQLRKWGGRIYAVNPDGGHSAGFNQVPTNSGSGFNPGMGGYSQSESHGYGISYTPLHQGVGYDYPPVRHDQSNLMAMLRGRNG